MIIHIDLDCFFVSAERTESPDLIGKAVAIGGRGDTHIFSHQGSNQSLNLDNEGSFVGSFFHRYRGEDLKQFIDPDGRIRGILTTSSYEARDYGIKTGMSIREALSLCPHLIIKSPNMELYHTLSHRLRDFLHEHIPLIEQASIDEFYGDLEGWIEDSDVPEFIDTLRNNIKRHINLPVSIGAAHSKYIAKLATDEAKPFGCKIIYPNEAITFVSTKNVAKFPGIGRSMLHRCSLYRIHTLGDLIRAKNLVESWGPYAQSLYQRVIGEEKGGLKRHAPRKSIGISRTFDPINDRFELRRRVFILARHLSYAISKIDVHPTTFSLHLRYDHYPSSHAAHTECRLFSEQRFRHLCASLFTQADIHRSASVIHLGISAGSFSSNTHKTLSLLHFELDSEARKLDLATQNLRSKYGLDTLRWGNEL